MKSVSKNRYTGKQVCHRLWEIYNKDNSLSNDTSWKEEQHKSFYKKLAKALNNDNKELYLKIGYEENPYQDNNGIFPREKRIIDTFLEEHNTAIFNEKIKGYLK